MARRAVAVLALIGGGAALAWWRSRQDQAAAGDDFAGQVGHQVAGFPFLPEPAPAGPWSTEAYLQTLGGLTPDQARGVAAGIWAESRGDPSAVNPTSGAYGLGQWLGSRKATLFARYGRNPSMADQLEFLVWELQGGDHGGKAVLAESTAAGTLDAYIRRFMRPGAGTAGDLARGERYLG